MGGIDGCGEAVEVGGAGSRDEHVVCKDPRGTTPFFDYGEPGAEEEGDAHHAEGAALGNPIRAGVWGSKASSNGVVGFHVLLETFVSTEEAWGKAGSAENFIDELPADLVEAFHNVDGCRGEG